MEKRKKQTRALQNQSIYKVYFLEEHNIRYLYQNRLTKELENLETKNNIEEE